jgi:hypothetical protein
MNDLNMHFSLVAESPALAGLDVMRAPSLGQRKIIIKRQLINQRWRIAAKSVAVLSDSGSQAKGATLCLLTA